jgi:serine/threonine protein kinase
MEARRLRRQSFSRNSRKPHSQKFVLPCKDKVNNGDVQWLEVKRRLSEKADVLEAVLSSRKAVVVKYGDPATIEHEYSVSSDLQNEPNFMKYYCSFTCRDSAEFRNRLWLCDGHGELKGFAVMPHYELGSVGEYPWKKSEIMILKNVLLQAAFAILQAHSTTGFSHGDMHLDNLLMRKTKKTVIPYDAGDVKLLGVYAVISDFDLSSTFNTPKFGIVNKPAQAYFDIRRMLRLTEFLPNAEFKLDCVNVDSIRRLEDDGEPITARSYDIVGRCVMSLKSSGPRMIGGVSPTPGPKTKMRVKRACRSSTTAQS